MQQPDLRKTAIGGALILGAGQATNAALQAAFLIILARLLTPADFGLTAMVFPVVFFVTMLQEGGLTSAVIQRKTISRQELSTLFWVNAAIGTALAAGLYLVAPMVAGFYHEPRVRALTAASGGIVLFGALAVQHLAILNREMRYGRMALVDSLAAIAGFVVAIAVAAVYHSYWAIWLRSFVTVVATFVFAWGFSGWMPGRAAPFRQVRDLIGFGANMTGFGLFNFASRNLDNILIGRVHGESALGLYDRAYRIVTLPMLLVNAPLNRIITPVLSRTRDEEGRYRSAFISTLQLGLLVTVPIVSCMVGAPTRVIGFLLGERWIGAAPLCAWLGIAIMLQLAANPLGWLYISQGRSRDMMLAGLANSMLMCVAFVIGVAWGALGIAIAYAGCTLGAVPILVWWATRRGPVRFGDFAGGVAPFALAAICCVAVVALLDARVSGPSLVVMTALGGASGATALLALSLTTGGRACLLRARDALRTGFGIMDARLRPS